VRFTLAILTILLNKIALDGKRGEAANGYNLGFLGCAHFLYNVFLVVKNVGFSSSGSGLKNF
jgi:hypothetical protein